MCGGGWQHVGAWPSMHGVPHWTPRLPRLACPGCPPMQDCYTGHQGCPGCPPIRTAVLDTKAAQVGLLGTRTSKLPKVTQLQSPTTLPTHHQDQEEGGEDDGGGPHAFMWLQRGMGEQGAPWLSMHIMPRGGGWPDLATTSLVG